MKTRWSSAVPFLAVAAILTALTGCSTSQPAPTSNASPLAQQATEFPDVPLVPDAGVAFGAYYGDADPADSDDALGASPLIHLTYFGWQDDWVHDPVIASDAEAGQVSLVNWEPFDVSFHDIVAGQYDDMLMQRGLAAAELDGQIFVDFAAEMNEAEGWGDHDPSLYVATYRHVHDVVSAYDDGRIVWVWAPNNVDSAGAPPAMDYYPGDTYVDWTGIDGYNWGTSDPDFTWQSFEEVFRPMYDELHMLGKPIIIAETASAEEGGSKPDWIADIVPTLQTEFPDIRALVWFDVDKERDWRIRSSPAAFDAISDLLGDQYVITAQEGAS